jgi:hypothetical protein
MVSSVLRLGRDALIELSLLSLTQWPLCHKGKTWKCVSLLEWFSGTSSKPIQFPRRFETVRMDQSQLKGQTALSSEPQWMENKNKVGRGRAVRDQGSKDNSVRGCIQLATLLLTDPEHCWGLYNTRIAKMILCLCADQSDFPARLHWKVS